jgi:hypothetical protein
LACDRPAVSLRVAPSYALKSFREDVSAPWLVLHAREPAESSVDSDLSTHPSYRVLGSNVSTTGARNKSPPDAPRMPVDPGPSDFSSSSYGAASPLHFHGLAVTQTQTQVASSAEATGEGGARPENRVCIPRLFNLARLLLSPCGCVSRRLLTYFFCCFRRSKGGRCLMIPGLTRHPKLR